MKSWLLLSYESEDKQIRERIKRLSLRLDELGPLAKEERERLGLNVTRHAVPIVKDDNFNCYLPDR